MVIFHSFLYVYQRVFAGFQVSGRGDSAKIAPRLEMKWNHQELHCRYTKWDWLVVSVVSTL